jgi:uncharacterized protein HemX
MDGNQRLYQPTTKRRNTAGGGWVRVLVLAVIAVALAGGFWLFERSPAMPLGPAAQAPAAQSTQVAQGLTPANPSNTGADQSSDATQPAGSEEESQRDQP